MRIAYAHHHTQRHGTMAQYLIVGPMPGSRVLAHSSTASAVTSCAETPQTSEGPDIGPNVFGQFFGLGNLSGQRQAADVSHASRCFRTLGSHMSTVDSDGTLTGQLACAMSCRLGWPGVISTGSGFLRSQQINAARGEKILDRRAMPAKATWPRSEGFDMQATSANTATRVPRRLFWPWAARLANMLDWCAGMLLS
jgi:hypothetical protein